MTNLILLLLALLVIPLKHRPKSIAWCLLELVVLYFVISAVAFYTEQATMGQVAGQNWEFYAVTASLFLVFAFPGFVYRYFWQRS